MCKEDTQSTDRILNRMRFAGKEHAERAPPSWWRRITKITLEDGTSGGDNREAPDATALRPDLAPDIDAAVRPLRASNFDSLYIHIKVELRGP
jgi:hypothetical protein